MLNFIGKAVVPSRIFTHRLYTKFANPKLKQNHHVNVDVEIQVDCRVLLSFLQSDEALTRPFIDFRATLVADRINFYIDASGTE